ncbi:MAG: 30S ribosome-binding factor RbfA [Desulfobulbaceae bacterium]|nr:30S ribosome-binding factor RbfA [Desulfobulbaceae bacterium]
MAMDFDFKLPDLGRPESSRPKRVAEAIRNELTLLLLQRVADPRLSGATISKVEVSPDLKAAKIYITAARHEEQQRTMAGVYKAKGFFRSHLAKTLNLRYTPELHFYYDDLAQEAERVEQLLTELERERNRGPA